MLPVVPGHYIAQLVYDRAHLSIAIVKKPFEVVGGVVYKSFEAHQFAEIAFFAIASSYQLKGYGIHLIHHPKDFVKSTSKIMHFMAYADDMALGFFKKQGFTPDITFAPSVWKGYIKDYLGDTSVQCSMLPRIRHLASARMLFEQERYARAQLRAAHSKSNTVHQPPEQWKNGVTPISPLSIRATRETG
ncbi:putative histone acetyltransferase GCN5 [Rosellinia necatrix]|uniref:Putative histone acetyltransferase GCN5 n=1 Tax=Rosellinia necatrix TaxID=77044 RepID=A0A1S8A702_ROSNE|nr:putative histone acetyltransferase GCN5 [Rosellinia necatrix]